MKHLEDIHEEYVRLQAELENHLDARIAIATSALEVDAAMANQLGGEHRSIALQSKPARTLSAEAFAHEVAGRFTEDSPLPLRESNGNLSVHMVRGKEQGAATVTPGGKVEEGTNSKTTESEDSVRTQLTPGEVTSPSGRSPTQSEGVSPVRRSFLAEVADRRREHAAKARAEHLEFMMATRANLDERLWEKVAELEDLLREEMARAEALADENADLQGQADVLASLVEERLEADARTEELKHLMERIEKGGRSDDDDDDNNQEEDARMEALTQLILEKDERDMALEEKLANLIKAMESDQSEYDSACSDSRRESPRSVEGAQEGLEAAEPVGQATDVDADTGPTSPSSMEIAALKKEREELQQTISELLGIATADVHFGHVLLDQEIETERQVLANLVDQNVSLREQVDDLVDITFDSVRHSKRIAEQEVELAVAEVSVEYENLLAEKESEIAELTSNMSDFSMLSDRSRPPHSPLWVLPAGTRSPSRSSSLRSLRAPLSRELHRSPSSTS